MPTQLKPKLFTLLKEGYTSKQFFSDLTAGLIVGIVALPLAIAFAIASGVKPEQGLYTAVIAGLAAAVLGGSRVQISGPTGAFIVVIYGIVQQYGYDGLVVATLIAGVLLVLMGLARMGVLLKFIPFPVTIGFTSGIAVVIFSTQIRDLLGLQLTEVPAEFVAKWLAYARHIDTINPYTLAIGLLSLAIIILWPRVTNKVPGPLIAILAATAIVQIWHLPVDTINSRFGAVPNSLPMPHLPHISWNLVTKMFSPAVTIALLAAIESLLSAVVADGMLGTRHRSNMELIGQGVANIFSPLFGGIPATGAIARTATNIKNGGRTPIAAIVHAFTLLFIILFFGQWAALIPMPALAAILVFVAYNMSEWREFVKTLRSPRSDVIVLLLTFFLTVLIDLTVAIEVGVVMAAFLFLQRMSNATQVEFITKQLQDENEEDADNNFCREMPPGVEIFEITGSLFFGAIDRFNQAMRDIAEKPPKVLILRMRNVLTIDAAGLHAIEDLLKKTNKAGTVLMLSGVHSQPYEALQYARILEHIGADNIHNNIDDALMRAKRLCQD